MTWAHLILSALSALVGGAAGGWLVAYRMGQWRQSIEDRVDLNTARLDDGKARVREIPRIADRLASIEARLAAGDEHVGRVPVLVERVNVLIESVDEIKAGLRDLSGQVVTRRECAARHAAAQEGS